MPDDRSPFAGAAAHYLRGRPPYSAELADVLRDELGLDGTGALVDVGCGPGVLVVQLAELFADLVAVDPDAEMLDEARRHATASGVSGVRWIHARAEQLPELDVPRPDLVTFGQSFHWTDRRFVAEAVFDLLVPGGSIAMITHDIDDRPPPIQRPEPPIPHDAIRELVRRYVGTDTPLFYGPNATPPERYEVALGASRFGPARTLFARGRPDIVRDVDEVIAGYLSMSFAAPPRLGDDLDAFVTELRLLLARTSPSGRFWDWPGDTAVILATKPAE